MRSAIRAKARSLMRYRAADASRWQASARSSHTASKRCTRVPGRYDVGAQPPHGVHRAAVDAGYVRDGAAGRVLHRQLPAADHRGQPRLQLFAPGVYAPPARQVVEHVALDAVDQRLRLAAGRYQVVPAARRQAAAAIQAGHRPRDRVRAVEVVQQPAVQPFLAQGVLHGADVDDHVSQYSRGPLRPARGFTTASSRLDAGRNGMVWTASGATRDNGATAAAGPAREAAGPAGPGGGERTGTRGPRARSCRRRLPLLPDPRSRRTASP